MSATETIPQMIDRVLDGAGTADEIRELETRAAASEEIRRDLDASRRLFAELAAAANVAVPPTLKNDVMTKIREERGTPDVPIAAARARRRQWIAIAWAAAAAIVLAVIYPVTRTFVTEHDSAVSGAMVTAVPAWQEVARAGHPATGTASMRRSGKRIEIRVSLPSPGRADVTWDPAALGAPGTRTRSGEITLKCPAGRCETLILEAESTLASVSVHLPGGNSLQLSEAKPTP
jgi:hypothetical protein